MPRHDHNRKDANRHGIVTTDAPTRVLYVYPEEASRMPRHDQNHKDANRHGIVTTDALT